MDFAKSVNIYDVLVIIYVGLSIVLSRTNASIVNETNEIARKDFKLFMDALNLNIPTTDSNNLNSDGLKLFRSELKHSQIGSSFVQIGLFDSQINQFSIGKQMLRGGGNGGAGRRRSGGAASGKQISHREQNGDRADTKQQPTKKKAAINHQSLIESSLEELKLSIKYLSSMERHDERYKHQARQYIYNMFESFGLIAIKQKFKAPHLKESGINIIGIKRGTIRKQPKKNYRKTNENDNNSSDEDRILLIGAHYDTVKGTSGTNDNGSGMGVMLEMVRLLDYYQCQLHYTVMFVAFDQEELGAIGSKYFVLDYLIPNELAGSNNISSNDSTASGSKFNGAIILDTVLNFDPEPESQDVSYDIHKYIPEFSQRIKQRNYTGDFLAMFARTGADQHLSKLIGDKWKSNSFRKSYKNETYENRTTNHRLYPILIRTLSTEKAANATNLKAHINMLRSDHIHFWYHNHTDYRDTLSAVMLTDTGPFRGYMRSCYHRACDDSRYLTTRNLNFIKKTTDVLTQVILDASQGKCYAGGEPHRISTASKLNRNITTFRWLNRKPRNNWFNSKNRKIVSSPISSNCANQNQAIHFQIVQMIRILFEELIMDRKSGQQNRQLATLRRWFRNDIKYSRTTNLKFRQSIVTSTNNNKIDGWWKSIVCTIYEFANSLIGVGSILLILNDFK